MLAVNVLVPLSFLTSFILLDAVFSNCEWSCHPADSSHVGRIWRANLWLSLPMAGQKYLHTVPPHDHVSKVWQKNAEHVNSLSVRQQMSLFVMTLCSDNISLRSRLPNPIYLGTLIAGLFHSLLCFYGKIMPIILNKSSISKISSPCRLLEHLAFLPCAQICSSRYYSLLFWTLQ